MAEIVSTPAGDLYIGRRYDLVLQHGTSRRVVANAKIVSFQQDGDTRYQAESESIIVGFLAANVVTAKLL